jgi:hypothetical protein
MAFVLAGKKKEKKRKEKVIRVTHAVMISV